MPRARPAANASVADRRAAGKAARTDAPRSAHAGWTPAPDRADPVAILQRQALTRVPELVPIRYQRMLASPLAFYRGAAAIMAADLAATPRSGFETQICGDAHLSNFGIFAAPDRRLVFDVNDFDETLTGPWEWDVKRLAASVEIAARQRGAADAEHDAAVLAGVRRYREAMRAFADMPNLQVWYARFDVATAIEQLADTAAPEDVRDARRFAAKAESRSSVRAVAKLTERVDGQRVVEGQRFMQSASDIFLGWERAVGFDGRQRDFYIRQLWDGKGSVDVETMAPARLAVYAQLCGWTLARAHARSGDRIAIGAYAVFDEAIRAFASAYADQNGRDFAARQAAAADGRVVTQDGARAAVGGS